MANAGTIAPSDRRAAASTSQSSANVPGARDTTYSGSVQRQLPKRRPRKGLSWPRLSWWFELATVAVAYLIYEATRALVKSKEGPAISHGKDILHVERWAHLDPEVGLNHFLNLSKFLSDGAAFYYSALHFLITPLVLIYLWRRHPEIYPRFRSALLAATAVALVVFVAWPVAPHA